MGTAMEPQPVKQLRELLDEQQEPFIPELHLFERAHLRKSLRPERDFSFCCGNSRKSLKKLFDHCRSKNEKAIPHCSQVIKAVYNQVVSINERLRIKTSSHDTEKDRNKKAVAELDRLSSASSTTVYHSCSGSDAEETSTSLPKEGISLAENSSKSFRILNLLEETATDRKLRWRCIKDSKQPSPVSVLEDVPSNGGSPLHGNKTENFTTRKEDNPSKVGVIWSKKITESSILSAFLWKILLPSETKKPISAGVTELQELVQSSASLQHFRSKGVLQQTKQLAFDFVREVLVTRGRKQQQQWRTYLASEELGKRIDEKIVSWGNHARDEPNLKNLLYSNLLETIQEWSAYEQQRREIGIEIGDAISKEIMDDIVADMIIFTTFPFFPTPNMSQNYQMSSPFQNSLLQTSSVISPLNFEYQNI